MSNQVLCPYCNSTINATDKFCAHCGEKLEQPQKTFAEQVPAAHKVVCLTCGSVNPLTNAICVSCGSELSIPQQTSQETSLSSIKHASSKKQKVLKTSSSTYVIIAFIAVVVALIVFEFRNSQSSHTHISESDVQKQKTDDMLLSEIASLESALKTDPKNTNTMLQLANKLHDARFFPRAIEAYKNYLKAKPNDADAKVDLGICYFETGDSQQAIKEITSVLKTEPKHQMAMFNLGIIHLSSGNLSEAKKWFKQCVNVDPASTAGLRAQELLQQH